MCYLCSGENILRTKFLITLSLVVLVTLIRVLMCHGKALVVVHLDLLGIGSHHRGRLYLPAISTSNWSSWSRSMASILVYECLWMMFLQKLCLICKKTFIIVISQSKTCRCARARNLKLINDFFPQFSCTDLDWSSPYIDSFIELAKIKLFPANTGYFEVVVAQFSLKLDEVILKFLAFSPLVFVI